VISLSRHTPYR